MLNLNIKQHLSVYYYQKGIYKSASCFHETKTAVQV